MLDSLSEIYYFSRIKITWIWHAYGEPGHLTGCERGANGNGRFRAQPFHVKFFFAPSVARHLT